MFCNRCGKENKAGTKFCVQCGAPLRANSTNADNNATLPGKTETIISTGKNTGIKNLLTVVLLLVLLVIAAVNIIKVQFGVFNISIRNELQQANKLSNICETNSYIYFISDALYRMDKASETVTKVSNKYIYPSVATSTSIYGYDDNGNCYKASDKSSEVEKIEGIKCGTSDSILMSGKYNYIVSLNGSITKNLNSAKYSGYTVDLYSGNSGDTLIKAKMYKDYIYMILSRTSSYSDGKLIRVSVKTGKEEKITNNTISDFSFSENQIICNDTYGGFFVMNLDGGNEREYTEIKSINNASFICANGYVYYIDNSKLYRFSVSGGETEELEKAYYGLTEVNGGFAQSSGNELMLIDYAGNEISTVEP